VIELTKRYAFPAAHVLCQPDLSEAENDRIFGKCANPNGHGHNYGVEVSVEGPLDPRSGQIVSLHVLDRLFQEQVGGPFSHRMLNQLPVFAGRVPTAEVIAVVIHDELSTRIARETTARLTRVRVVETPKNSTEYGDQA
jgi:6-pyruvoyltetrahydropterin/6-carboxytetrahydropterin synthase